MNIQDLIISGHQHLFSQGYGGGELSLSLSPKNYADLYTNCVDMGMAFPDPTYGGKTLALFRSPFGELKLEVKKNVPDDEMWFTVSGVYLRYCFTKVEMHRRPLRRLRMLRPIMEV